MTIIDYKNAVAKTNIGSSWESTWNGLVNGSSNFVSPEYIHGLKNWPKGAPLGMISDWNKVDAPLFEERTVSLLSLLAKDIWPSIKKNFLGKNKARISAIIATSHGDPGPTAVFAENEIENLSNSVLKRLCFDNLSEPIQEVFESRIHITVISAACASTLVATILASKRIKYEISDVVVVFAVDTLSRVAYNGFNRVGAMSKSGTMPFDSNRDGMTASEGGAAFAICKECYLNDTTKIALLGGDYNCDRSHMVEPSIEGLYASIANNNIYCGVPANKIDFVYWHGTGTILNDKTEAEVAKAVFGNKIPPGCSTKGSLGHTMGASGAYNILGTCNTLAFGILPPTARFSSPAFEGMNISKDSRELKDCSIGMCVSLGFGGINSSLIFKKIT